MPPRSRGDWLTKLTGMIPTLVRWGALATLMFALYAKDRVLASLSGALDEAEAWAAEARRGTKADAAADTLLVIVDAVVALRRGDAARAASLLDARWEGLEATLLARFYRGVRVLRAFAIESASGGPAPTSEQLLAGARPFTAGEFAWLGAEWPEMRAYVEAAGLAGVA